MIPNHIKQFFWPRSLLSRTLLLTLISVFMAQSIATIYWYTQSKQRELSALAATSESLAAMFASTTEYFQSLPVNYRQIALEQLRNMGGARFFVSFNRNEIEIAPISDSQAKQKAIKIINQVLTNSLPNAKAIRVEFSAPEKLKVLDNNLLLTDLPPSWAYNTLSMQPLNPPILVVQIALSDQQWVYMAALLPQAFGSLENALINADQLVFLASITVLLLFFTFSSIRNQTRPLKQLAHAANRLSTDIEQPPLKEEGALEIATVTRAFNLMQTRLQRYMHDREKLFRSISHDLKTPITRLRLRAELIDDEIQSHKINKDLDELEMMVKGALQTVKDTDIHENISQIDVIQILQSIAEVHNQHQMCVHIKGTPLRPFCCKPLAFKRCLTNLIDNGVKYGHEVTVYLYDHPTTFDITLIDKGAGIEPQYLTQVFDPYFRLHSDIQGSGLGLGIAKNIIHALGGEIILSNQPMGGLQIDLTFPRIEQV